MLHSGCMVYRQEIDTLTVRTETGCQVDVSFVLDSSGSIKKKHYQHMKKFVMRYVTKTRFELANDGLNVGVVSYATEV